MRATCATCVRHTYTDKSRDYAVSRRYVSRSTFFSLYVDYNTYVCTCTHMTQVAPHDRLIDRSRYTLRGRAFFASLMCHSRTPTHARTTETRAADGKLHLNRTCARKKLLYSRQSRPHVQLLGGKRMAPHRVSSPLPVPPPQRMTYNL